MPDNLKKIVTDNMLSMTEKLINSPDHRRVGQIMDQVGRPFMEFYIDQFPEGCDRKKAWAETVEATMAVMTLMLISIVDNCQPSERKELVGKLAEKLGNDAVKIIRGLSPSMGGDDVATTNTVAEFGGLWVILEPDITAEALGLIPTYLSIFDKRPAREQLDEGYKFAGGWQPQRGFAMLKDHSLKFSGDEPLKPLATTKVNDEEVFVYPHGYVSIVQPDGSFEACRMD